ncbi:hypothetical protein BG418_08110 [Streptomyces sp. CBMA152]|nr:hypothetical protein [Streptomyces sp. CBMA152]
MPEPCLVHGRLDTDNPLWDGRGRLVSVLGGDPAQLFDPALDIEFSHAGPEPEGNRPRSVPPEPTKCGSGAPDVGMVSPEKAA